MSKPFTKYRLYKVHFLSEIAMVFARSARVLMNIGYFFKRLSEKELHK